MATSSEIETNPRPNKKLQKIKNKLISISVSQMPFNHSEFAFTITQLITRLMFRKYELKPSGVFSIIS